MKNLNKLTKTTPPPDGLILCHCCLGLRRYRI